MRFAECNRPEPNIPAPARPKLRPLIPNLLRNSFATHRYGGGRDTTNAAAPVSTRWNPTPQQLQALEEIYGRGIRTPSAQQIQQITGKLRGFGKIEGKNVFYWFQNHKARERQRKRRQMEAAAGEKSQPGRRYSEAQHPKELLLLQTPTTSECSAAAVQECEEGDNWSCCRELEGGKRCCWPLEVLSSCIEAAQENGKNEFSVAGNGNGNHQTLELFPVAANMQQEKCCAAPNKPNQFFEFLPTKITEGLSL